ncbi:MAG TPA: hypothetical protein VGB37_14525 [Candidatus Lokiarchaeia archaeon]
MKFKKINKDYRMLLMIVAMSILFKVLEWIGQYLYLGNLSHLSNYVWLEQLLFISLISVGLFLIFDWLKLKKRIIWLIPTFAYFLKEVYNLIFVFGKLNQASFIGLIIEPFFLLFLNKFIVRYYVRKN